MNEVVTSKTEPGKKLSVGLQSRLLYLLLKCPMLQNRGQGCACGEQDDIEAETVATDDFAGCTAARGRAACCEFVLCVFRAYQRGRKLLGYGCG